MSVSSLFTPEISLGTQRKTALSKGYDAQIKTSISNNFSNNPLVQPFIIYIKSLNEITAFVWASGHVDIKSSETSDRVVSPHCCRGSHTNSTAINSEDIKRYTNRMFGNPCAEKVRKCRRKWKVVKTSVKPRKI